MKESHWKGVATHPGPESWAVGGNLEGQAFDRGRCGSGIEPRKYRPVACCTGFLECRRAWRTRKATLTSPFMRGDGGLYAVADPVHAPTHRAREPGDPTTDCTASAARIGTSKDDSR
jgi:hypothetical protein